MKLTAEQVRDRLIANGLYSFSGNITFKFGGIDITVKEKDVVGNIIQSWMKEWLDQNSIEYAVRDNLQMPPDFYLDPNNKEHSLLEVKAFNYDAPPGFDIADFKMYAREILTKPYFLNTDYLIFGYKMDKATGDITIKDIWLKKVWEITRRANKYPINVQEKDKTVHKIRPGVWYRDNTDKLDFLTFSCVEDFISAIDETLHSIRGQTGDINASTWKSEFIESYKNYYHKKLIIPKWNEIEDKYDLRPAHDLGKAIAERDKAQLNVEKKTKRVTDLENKRAGAHTPKQIEAAESSLAKAREALSKATFKLAETQAVLDQLLSDSNL